MGQHHLLDKGTGYGDIDAPPCWSVGDVCLFVWTEQVQRLHLYHMQGDLWFQMRAVGSCGLRIHLG
jgi:hypothetical protein